jgi:hypothetical protein
MKKVSLAAVCLTAIALSPRAHAGDQIADTDEQNGFGLTAGYRAIELKGTAYAHNTNPNDSFLPNSNVPGSAGTTSLDGRTLSYGSLGVNYQHRLISHLHGNIEIGALFGGGMRDERQNANDPRPAANAAFVYSKALNYGGYAQGGLSYDIWRFSLGIEGSVSAVGIDNGWDRYNSDQSEQQKWRFPLAAGPMFGVQLPDGISFKAGFQIGEHSREGLIQITLTPF